MYIFKIDRYLLRKLIKKYSHYIQGKVLDVGAGEWNRYQQFFKASEYIKMDIEKGENVDVVGSAENIPFDNEIFDAVVCTQVLEHLKDPFKAVAEIARILKQGGQCLITVPQTNELHAEPNDYFRYTKFGLEEIFKKVGLEMIECEAKGGLFSLLADLKMRYLIDRFGLHNRLFWGRVASKFFTVWGKLAMALDRLDKSSANHKHTIGWCGVFKKRN